MNIIPVLDLMNGQVVHAKHGDRHQYTPIQSALTDSSEPLLVVQALLALYPFKQLYIADINAIQKNGHHQASIIEITTKFPALELWLDAGFDTVSSIEACQQSNIRPVLGSESLQDMLRLATLLAACKTQPILSLDYRDDVLQGPADILQHAHLWPEDVIVMTLNKVGSNTGPDMQKLATLKNLSKTQALYAAGGVRNLSDLVQLNTLSISGVLIASALHNRALSHQQIKSMQT